MTGAAIDVKVFPGAAESNFPCPESARTKSKLPAPTRGMESVMAESVYKIIELVGTSTESWEKAANAAVDRASKSLRDLRIAEISQLDMQLKDGKVEAYRAKVKVSFKYEGGD
jgi:dodecin